MAYILWICAWPLNLFDCIIILKQEHDDCEYDNKIGFRPSL